MSEAVTTDVPKVPCPRCGEWASRVKDGRPSRSGYRRLRICQHCGERYRTLEQVSGLIKKSPPPNISGYGT